MSKDISKQSQPHNSQLQGYYRFHSKIYDLTRWSFLFGREEIINSLPDLPPDPRILEIGCGTGKNLQNLGYLFPDATIYGIDLSGDMIKRAQRKINGDQQINLIEGAYGDPEFVFDHFNLILVSYTLTMLGEQIEDMLQNMYNDLTPGGYVAVVDFNYTSVPWFRRWMRYNHVDMSGHLPPLLKKYFTPIREEINSAYMGLWNYLQFIGLRK